MIDAVEEITGEPMTEPVLEELAQIRAEFRAAKQVVLREHDEGLSTYEERSEKIFDRTHAALDRFYGILGRETATRLFEGGGEKQVNWGAFLGAMPVLDF